MKSNQRLSAMYAMYNVGHGAGYLLWRSWGFRSRLSELVAGPSGTQKQAENTQIQASQGQIQLAQQEQQLQSQQYNDYRADIQPLQTKLTALAGGDRNLALSAAMPVISQISGGYDAAKQRIMDTIPPGVGRDTALSNLEVQKATTTGGAMASAVEKAPEELAALGGGIGSMSLQQLGAALSGFSGATQSAGAVAQEENASQQNKLGLIGSLAGAAGTAAGGIFAPKPCWIAEVIYGLDDPRTHLVRAWINGPFRETRTGRGVVRLYLAIGRQAAWAARRCGPLRAALRPLFNMALKRAMAPQRKAAR